MDPPQRIPAAAPIKGGAKTGVAPQDCPRPFAGLLGARVCFRKGLLETKHSLRKRPQGAGAPVWLYLFSCSWPTKRARWAPSAERGATGPIARRWGPRAEINKSAAAPVGGAPARRGTILRRVGPHATH